MPHLVQTRDLPLLVDLYELSMAQAYWDRNMREEATFSLFFRELPPRRHFMLACGQQSLAEILADLRFEPLHLQRLEQLQLFQPEFLRWLGEFRFSGQLRALPEGTPVFPNEPLLEIDAPIAEAQLLESLVMNYVHLETVLASQAARLVLAARGRPLVDFGMRRMQGLDAAYRGVRAYRIAGLAGTSNVLAGQDFGLPVRGTMAHSFIQACHNQLEAFKTYARLYPGTTLLVDTYDTREAVDQIIEWLKGDPDTEIGAIRLDSGNLLAESRYCRERLDEAGFERIRILASGSLDEYRIHKLLDQGAPIDGFGVGSALGTGGEAPSLDLAYKLTQYQGQPSMKRSPGKAFYPGPKQVYRTTDTEGSYSGDRVTHWEEQAPGEPLLHITMSEGQPVPEAMASLEDRVDLTREALERLPEGLKSLEPGRKTYPVKVSEHLRRIRAKCTDRLI